MSYSDYITVEEVRAENVEKTKYEKVLGGLLSYNSDGITLLDVSGQSQYWNVSFEMQDPQFKKKGDFVLIYDRQGTIVELVDETGEIARINTSYPVNAACLSESGNIAIVMQQQDTAHIVLYTPEGTVFAEGEMHGGEGGYPMSIALSKDGMFLAVSALYLQDSIIGTQMKFYNFSTEKEIDTRNETSSQIFESELLPLIDFVDKDKLIAFGTNSIKFFLFDKEPKVSREISYDREIKSIMHNESYFGIITETENEEGKLKNTLDFYTISGVKRFTKIIDGSYDICKMMDNNEVLIGDGRKTSIYTSLGIEKFNYQFETDIQNIFPSGHFLNYYLLQGGTLSSIKLR